MPRRGFFRLGLRKAAQAAADAVSALGSELSRRMPAPPPPPVRPYRSRPPGATSRFLELCTKCNDCVQACPAWAIRVAREDEPDAGFPVLEPNTTACALCDDPVPCIAACATAALVATPRKSVRLGLARLDAERCLVPRGQPCDLCVVHCPVPDDAIRMTETGPLIVGAGCTGCGLCVVMCPERALAVVARA